MTTAPVSSPPRINEPRRAIGQMLGAGVLLTANDAASKWVTTDLPVGELIFVRGTFGLLFLSIFVRLRFDWALFRVVNWRGQALRASLSAISTLFFIFGLAQLPLANCISLMFSAPLFTAALAPAVLGERVGWRRWCAVVVGFTGVIVLLRPSAEGIQWAALLPLVSAFLGATRDLVTRRISVTETSLSILFVSMLTETLLGGAVMFFAWTQPSLENLAVLALGGALFVLSQFFFVEAFRNAEASIVAPFRYALLLSASLWGYLLWGDLPDRFTLVGAGIIMTSGLYILFRETRLARQPKSAEPA